MNEKGIQKRLVNILRKKQYSIMCENSTDLPDVIARKNLNFVFFEVKDKLFEADKTIGQCLRQVANTRVSGYSLRCSKSFESEENRLLECWEVEPIREVGLVVPVDSSSWYLKKLQILEKVISSLKLPMRLIIGTGEGLNDSLAKIQPTPVTIKRMQGDENFLEYKAAKIDEYIKLGYHTPPNKYREMLSKRLPYLPLRPDLVWSKELKPFSELLETSKMK